MSDTITQLAKPPYHRAERNHVRDATGSLVITCDDEILCMLFSEREVEKDGHFMCPKCGRLGQRMVEATPAQCGLTDSSPAVDRAAHGSPTLGEITPIAGSGMPLGVGGVLETVEVAECIEYMKALPDACVDAVISDLPYGTTSCKWDDVIPFGPLWAALERVLTPKGVVVLTAGQPFTSALVMSNPRLFKYCLVWKKSKCGSPLLAKYRPMMKHEDVVVFGTSKSTYNPQMEVGKPYARNGVKVLTNNHGYGLKQVTTDNKGTRYPGSVLDFPQQWRRQDQIHPTQKPIELMRYLVRTYTNPGDVVLDMCCGSGTTLVAAKIEGRQFIGCDSEEKYVTIARGRLASEFFMGGGGGSETSHRHSESGNGEVSDTATTGGIEAK